tara:strand:+ start:127 stop:405 length:279 start_codon:yes stop_codon:yes gene_type:complete
VEFLKLAVGDIINSITTVSGWATFQPAASIEIIVLFNCTNVGASNHAGLTDGVTTNYDTPLQNNPRKIGITNTNYLFYYGAGGQCFSGVQTK